MNKQINELQVTGRESMTTSMTGAEAIIKSLLLHGVDTVFGLPGGQLDHLFDAMYKEGDKLRLIHTRHEQGVAYMAYGYAKSTGKVGTYMVVPGPGLLNSTAALCTAWANHAQVLCISGQLPTTTLGKGYGDLHEINDQLGLIRHLTKWAERIDHPTLAPGLVQEAFRQLNTGCPRPVEIEMPMDIMGMQAEVQLLPPADDLYMPSIDIDLVEQAAEVLGNAKKPMIVIGAGAIDAGEELLAVAEALQAPVMSKRNGKGIISSTHYLEANMAMGHTLWGDADAVLAVGTRLKMPLTMWGKDDELKLVRVDIDPDQVNRICTPEVGIVGDAAAVLSALANALETQKNERLSRKNELINLKKDLLCANTHPSGPTDGLPGCDPRGVTRRRHLC